MTAPRDKALLDKCERRPVYRAEYILAMAEDLRQEIEKRIKAEARYAGLAEIEKKGEKELERIRSHVEDVEGERDALRAEVERLRRGMHRISLASQNSMSSKEECGRIARETLKEVE